MSDRAIAEFGLVQIGQIAVSVSDIERAIAFYRDTLGMRFLFQAPPSLGFFDCAGVRLMFDAPAKTQGHNKSPVICYRVPDLYDRARSCNGWKPRAPRRLKPAARVRCRIAHGDLEAAFEVLSARGVRFAAKPHLIAKLPDHELWMAFFCDPDQNLLALMSEVRP